MFSHVGGLAVVLIALATVGAGFPGDAEGPKYL